MHTGHGNLPIERIEVGEKVLARNIATGKLEEEPVIALTPLHRDKLLEIRIEGEPDPLRPSTSRPFWVRRGDARPTWIEAGQLRMGYLVESMQSDWRRITAITPVAQEETVYNFTVANDHDYFVGETGFLVHNAGGCGCNYRKAFFDVYHLRMQYYVLKPEAAGDFGPNTIYIDMRARPILVKKFHYEFSCGWAIQLLRRSPALLSRSRHEIRSSRLEPPARRSRPLRYLRPTHSKSFVKG